VTAVLLGAAPVVSARLIVPGAGAWIASLDLDLPDDAQVPSGRVVVTVGAETLTGTVDASASGRLGRRMRVQVVAGGGGWDRVLPAAGFHNDFGVTSSAVYQATAASLGEVVVDSAPVRLGVDFVRSAGPASRVFGDRPWYVDAAGVTRAGARPQAAASSEVELLEFDPVTRRAVLASAAIVWPGTVLTDSRYGAYVVRDVEQTFGEHGTRTVAWCETGHAYAVEGPGQRLARALGHAAREAIRPAFLRVHRYRIVTQGVDGRVSVQALQRGGEVPELLELVPVWPGVAAFHQDFVLGTVCLVAFADGDPARPVVVGFDVEAPTPVTKVGAGTTAVVLASATFTAWIAGVTAYVNGLAPGTLTAPSGHVATKLKAE
jgi:hypothetical protein